MGQFERRGTAMLIVDEAISCLEDEECMNAGESLKLDRYSVDNHVMTLVNAIIGYGSNLTINGNVECDASLMAGRTGDYGAVGAVSGRPRLV